MSYPPPENERCQFTFADGRQCRMFRMPKHPDYCVMHWHQEEESIPRQNLGLELLGPSDRVLTTADVNRTLCRLLRLVAEGRISPRTAATLAYIGQQLTCVVSIMQREAQLGIEARYRKPGVIVAAQELEMEKPDGKVALAMNEMDAAVAPKGNGKYDLPPPV